MKVILAVDGSPNAEDAVEFTARHSWSDDTTVCVLTVVENMPPRSAAIWHGTQGVLEEMRREETARAGCFVRQVAERLQPSGVIVETMVRHGDPRTVIIDEAENRSADLIILGAQGYTGLAKFLMGSVSQAIVGNAPCSVTVVRRKVAAAT